MIVTFRTRMPVAETMRFEHVYEDVLQLDVEAKASILDVGYGAWLFVDGRLAGETYGISPALLDEDVDDVPERDPTWLYCYSTTILPEFRGHGLSKILVAYSIGQAREAGFTTIVGHATSPAMVAVRSFFGASFGAVHQGWFGTERVAHFYRLALA